MIRAAKWFLEVFATILPPRERWLLLGVLSVSIIAATLEVIGVASILPFMALVLNPKAINSFPALKSIGRAAGATGPHDTLLLFGFLTVGVLTFANAAAAANVFVQQRFAARTQTRLTSALFAGYFAQPYAFHVNRDAPSLYKVVIVDVFYVVSGVISPFIVGISRGLLALGVLALLFRQDPSIALGVTLALGIAYGLVFRLLKDRQRHFALESNRANLELYRLAHEGLGGIKELQVLGRETWVLTQFEAAAKSQADAQAANAVMTPLPRYVLEPLVFGGIVLMTMLLIVRGGSSQEVVPLLALYAFAGYRLLPALQQVFESAMSLRFNLPHLFAVHEDFAVIRGSPLASATETIPTLTFRESLELRDLSFTYAGSMVPALQDIRLSIRPNQSIGLVGRTGAGKTTLADLLLGLYEPSAGGITVDDVPLSTPAALRAWRQSVGYVSQHVFLANASVSENIAFGLPPLEIDEARVLKAARLAQADRFISALPDGFRTLVGERGVKLSGGQRQRLGIARALYHEPQVLIFDEATSALDGLTEDAVMDEIKSLSGDRTVILIAHRLRTVEVCDRIIQLEAGRVIGDAPYYELLETSAEFRRLVGRNTPLHSAYEE